MTITTNVVKGNKFMKKILICVMVIITNAIYSLPEITSENILEKTTKPILVVSSLGCDAGQSYVRSVQSALNDLEGLSIAWVSMHQTYRIFSGQRQVETGDIILVKDGKIIDSSLHVSSGKTGLLSSNEIRTWVYSSLAKNNIPFKMTKSEELFLEPVADSSPANLEDSFAAHFPLKTDFKNVRKEDTGDFFIGFKNKPPNGAYYMDGEYNTTRTKKGNIDEFYNDGWFQLSVLEKSKTGLGFFISMKPEKRTEGEDSFLFGLGDNDFNFFINNKTGKLKFSAAVYCPTCGKDGQYRTLNEKYEFKDEKVDFEKWHNFVVSVNLKERRVSTLLNGKRLKDIQLSKQFMEVYENKVSSRKAMNLSFNGMGLPFKGYARDVIFYSRTINANEMKELNKKYGDKSDVTPDKIVDPIELNKKNYEFLKASKLGKLSDVVSAYEGGAQINANYKNWSALTFAAFYGHEDIVKYLIAQQINVLHEFKPGWTSQRIAKEKGFDSIVALLENASNTTRFFAERKFNFKQERGFSVEAPDMK